MILYLLILHTILGLISQSVDKIFKNKMLNLDGVIILETDQEERILNEIEKYKKNIYDIRKYGRVKLIFLNAQERND